MCVFMKVKCDEQITVHYLTGREDGPIFFDWNLRFMFREMNYVWEISNQITTQTSCMGAPFQFGIIRFR